VIPLRDRNPTRRTPIVTWALIGACFAAFALELSVTASGGDRALEDLFQHWGAVPADITSALERGDFFGQAMLGMLTSMFLHGGWLHLLGNMWFLWIFGNNVEDRLKRPLFIAFYFLGGLAATGLQLAFGPGSAIPNVGASGAIAAVLGAYLVLFPRARVYTIVFFFFITAIELPALAVLGFWFVLQLFSGVGSLGADVNSGGVAYWAHVGGFAFGAAVTWLFFRGRGERRSRRDVPPRADYF